MKKSILKLVIVVILLLIPGIGCDKVEHVSKGGILKGKIVGYLKCSDNKRKNTLFGIFIISNNLDSLLSFNVPSSIYNLDTSKIDYGINLFIGDSISFNYRNAEKDEMKQFDCPPSTMEKITFYPIENFPQIIITNISKIK
jgi:hypothetical protein